MGDSGVTGAKNAGSIPGISPNQIASKQAPYVKSNMLGDNSNCCQSGGDPVNMATGNFMYEMEYLKINGLFPISFVMSYNAQEQRINSMGYGWTHNFEVCITKEDNRATVFFEDGRQEIFLIADNKIYYQYHHSGNSLSETDNGFVYRTREGIKYSFSANGRLTKKEDSNLNYVKLSYGEKGSLTKAGNNSGSSFSFSYYENGKLKQVTDNNGRTVSFEYQNDNLISVTDEMGDKRIYKYNSQNKISNIINPLGIDILHNEYDKQQRVTRQVFPDGGVITHEHKDDENKLIMTEQNGNKITYVHDDRSRSIATIYVDGTEQYAYNEQNLRTLYVDKNGNATKYSYDQRGNLIKTVNPLNETISTEYNNLNKPEIIKLCEEIKLMTQYDARGNAIMISDALERISKIEYNDNGKPIKIIQPDSSEIDIEYDTHGNILKISEAGSETKFEYDDLNRVINTTDGNGNKTGYEYDDRNYITKIIAANGLTRKYEYNAVGKVIKITDFDGGVLEREYNCLGKHSRFIDQEGNETKLEYDLMWNVSKHIDANGNAEVYEYNKLNKLEKIVNAKGAELRYEYDPNGNCTQITDPRGGQTLLTYDALNRVVGVTEPNGSISGVEYDSMGNITKIVDAQGNESAFTYDEAGQKISEIDPSGRELQYSYNLLGQISEVKDSADRTTKYEYLPGGLLEKTIFPDGRIMEYAYDANKNIISQTSKDGYSLSYEYDCMNQITKISSNKGQEQTFTYDAVGNVTAITDANGNTSKYIYSPAGNLIAVIDPLGNKSTYDYDKIGNLVESKQFAKLDEAKTLNEQNAKLRVTRYERNEINQVERIFDALGNIESYTYDDAGNLSSKMDKDGYLTKYAYNTTNQIEEIGYADGKSVKLSYNPLRQLTEIKDWLGLTTIDVDEVGRAKKITNHEGKVVEYTYGTQGERTGVKYPDGRYVEYQYDEALRLKTLMDGNNRINYFYDENSRLIDKVFSNGTQTNYSYNDLGLISELAHSDKDGILDKYTYTYDNMLNKTGIEKYRRGLEKENGKYQYIYDELSQLTGVFKDNEEIRKFGYDAFGNRSFKLDKGIRTDYTYNQLNQLLCAKDKKHTQVFSYDARGNLTQVLENGKVKNTYEFSPLNRLTTATNVKGVTANYDYNGLGFRVGKHITDDLNPAKDISYALDLTRQYHNMLQMSDDQNTQSFVWDYDVVCASKGSGDQFFMQDELGSPLRISGADGALVDSYGYDEFGNDLYGNHGIAQPFGYTGYQYDNIAETQFAQAREYDPKAGRFVSVDAAKGYIQAPITMHAYCYCWNNPIRYIDPSGYITEEEVKMYNDGKMAPMAYTYLMQLTYDWYLADTQKERDRIASLANAFRETCYTTTNGVNKVVDEGIKYMPKTPPGSPLMTSTQHYYRNQLNIEMDWDAFQKLQERLPEKLKWDGTVDSSLHQNNTIGKPNVKYVSACGHFEMIFGVTSDDRHILQTESNNPQDMGTYNYKDPKTNPIGHFFWDVDPYFSWENTNELWQKRQESAGSWPTYENGDLILGGY